MRRQTIYTYARRSAQALNQKSYRTRSIAYDVDSVVVSCTAQITAVHLHCHHHQHQLSIISIVSYESSIISYQSSATVINHQHHQLSITNHQLSIINHQSSASSASVINHQHRQLWIINHQLSSSSLPLHITSASSLTVFKQYLKLHLLCFSFPGLSPVWLNLSGPCSVCCH